MVLGEWPRGKERERLMSAPHSFTIPPADSLLCVCVCVCVCVASAHAHVSLNYTFVLSQLRVQGHPQGWYTWRRQDPSVPVRPPE